MSAIKKPRAMIVIGIVCLLAVLVACAPKATEQTANEPAPPPAGDTTAVPSGVNPNFPSEGRYVDNIAVMPEVYEHADKDARNAENNKPRTYVDRNGFTIQPVPSDPIGWNTTYLNADRRGCTACHTLEDAVMALPTYHRLIFEGYPAEQDLGNCIVCHTWSPNPLKDSIHTLHNTSQSFTQVSNGTCESCHYLAEGGEFKRWDYEKYDLYKGYITADSATAGLKPTWDQDQITPKENRFWKSIYSEPSEWLTDDSNYDKTIQDNWTIKVGGDVNNPFEMTIPEMVAQFGTVTEVMKMDCTVNGVGNPTIFQAEVTGIPIKALYEYAQPKAGVNLYRATGDDGYAYGVGLETSLSGNALLVIEMDGEQLPPSQGYPVASWIGGVSGGDYTKKVAEVTFEIVPADQVDAELFVGQFVDPATGEIASKPNSGVLNYPTGVVLENQVGKPVHLEGFADAWDEPITKVEFSLDRGATWTTMAVANHNPQRWVYWQMDYTPAEAGSYLLTIRTTSQQPDGSPRVCFYNTKFLFNVR